MNSIIDYMGVMPRRFLDEAAAQVQAKVCRAEKDAELRAKLSSDEVYNDRARWSTPVLPRRRWARQ
jgi:hypothetical protein